MTGSLFLLGLIVGLIVNCLAYQISDDHFSSTYTENCGGGCFWADNFIVCKCSSPAGCN